MDATAETRTRFDHTQGPRKLGPADGKAVMLDTIGVRFMAWAEETGGDFSLVEHPMPARSLAAPLHKHSREDEYSFVLEGRMGALLGDDVVHAEVGDFVFKPRDQWHTFWNAGDTECRILEIIAPGGFESYFDEISELFTGDGPPDFERLQELAVAYGLEMDPESIPGICEEHGLVFPGG